MSAAAQKVALWLLAGLFVMAIANAAARLTWTLAGQAPVEIADIATATASPAPRRAVDLSPIIALAPFGSATVAAAPAPVAQETSLGFILRGLVIAVPARDSIAVVALKDGVANLYGVGDTIDGKAIVKDILADAVLLQVGDRVETLSFPKPEDASKAGVARIVAGLTNSGVAAPAATGSTGAAATMPVIEEYRRKIALNPQSVLDSFGVSVSQNGYSIDPNATSSVLRAGFRPGDLISRVNGEQVGDIEKDRSLIDSVIASGRVRIEVVRDGKNVVMSFPLR